MLQNTSLPTTRTSLPLSARKIDWLFVGFFVVNLFFITYIVDFEQLVIADPTPGRFSFEELLGPHATLARGIVLFANAPWLLFPILMLWRMWPGEHPFAARGEPGVDQ